MLTESITIDRPLSLVYAAFRDLSYWCKVLPDVLSVETLYDDGEHQEFLMTVERPSGPETVRGARFCVHDAEIELVQPQPPPAFSRMVGRWSFEPDGRGATRVTARRWFALKSDANPAAHEKTARMLSGYLRTNLERFAAALQGAA